MNDAASDPFDLEALEMPDELIPTKRMILSKERRQLGQFVQFPRTWAWRLRNSQSAATWKLACYLLWRRWKRKLASDEDLVVSNGACARWGVSRDCKRRALVELETLGLIRVKRCHGSNPKVVLLFPEPDREERLD